MESRANPKPLKHFYRLYVVLSGALIAISYLQWLRADSGATSLWGNIFLYIYLCFFFGGAVYGLIYRWAIPKWENDSVIRRNLAFVFCVLFGLWLTIAIPVDYPVPMQEISLQVIATGDRNTESQGGEVWLSRAVDGNGNIIPQAEFSPGEGWEIREGVLFSSGMHENAVLTWSGKARQPVHLFFVSHPWSGVAEIRWNDQSQIIDLYDPAGKEAEVIVETAGSTPELFSNVIFHLSVGYSIGLVLFVLTTWLIFRKPTAATGNFPRPVFKRSWMWYSMAIATGFVCYWLIFFPGIMGSDVNDQWGQMVRFQINDAHPAFHTLYLWALSRVWYSPASIALFQIVIFSILGGKLLALYEHHGAPKGMLWLIALVAFGFNPVNALNVISLWKDTIFAACFLGLFYLLLKLILSSGKLMEHRSFIMWLGLDFAFLTLFRHNGVTVPIAVVIGLSLFYVKRYKQILLAITIWITLVLLVRYPLYALIKVEPTPERMFGSFAVHNIAYHLVKDTPLTNDQAQYLNSLYPIETNWHYSDYCAISVVFNPDFAWSKGDNGIFTIFLKLNLGAPISALNYYEKQSALVYRVRNMDGYVWVFHEPLQELFLYPSPNDLSAMDIQPHSLSPELATRLGNWISTSRQDNRINWFIWRPALYMYITIFVIICKTIKEKQLIYLLLLFPILAQSLTMAFLIPCQDFRYQFPVYVIGVLSPILLFTNNTSLIESQ